MKSVNPYRTGLGLIYNRLLWDRNIGQSLKNHNKLKTLRNKELGNKAVILCNGPSLNKVKFEDLTNIKTFGLNKINLLFDNNNFRPDYIISVNGHVIEQNSEFYNATAIPLFLEGKVAKKSGVHNRNNVTFLNTGGQGFAQDCSVTIPEGHTVTYVALQLAFHFGFTKVALVGCDHYFSQASGEANSIVRMESDDENHFDPRYFRNQNWQLPDIIESEISYLRAKKAYQEAGRELFNCTEGGALTLLPKIPLSDFLQM